MALAALAAAWCRSSWRRSHGSLDRRGPAACPARGRRRAGAITAALGITIAPDPAPGGPVGHHRVLLCLLLAVTGQFIRRGRESQDRTELLLAQLQDAREAEAAAAALAERSRIAGELHDVLAHSLSGLAIQLQGARKLAAPEPVSDGPARRDRAVGRTGQGRTRRRQASRRRPARRPAAHRGPAGALVEDFRRDTGTDATLLIDGTRRQLPAEAAWRCSAAPRKR